MGQSFVARASGVSDRLFVSLAEELKLPLQQIARRAELGRLHGVDGSESLEHIQLAADTTLKLLDGYLLSLRLAAEPDEHFIVEPVNVSAVLHETRSQLAKVAAEYGVTLELNVQGKYEPVMAHRRALTTALVSLGHCLIESIPAMGTHRQMCLQLAAHRTSKGIVAGMYCEVDDLTPAVLRRAQSLQGQARQALVSVSPGSGAGVFVADAILAAMSSHLRVGRFQKQSGFAVTLTPSQQMALV